MIDFKDCPKDENWLLFDNDGNCELMTNEIKKEELRLKLKELQ